VSKNKNPLLGSREEGKEITQPESKIVSQPKSQPSTTTDLLSLMIDICLQEKLNEILQPIL